eukprot:TRINITY_DN11051_c0_g1_i1.p1 TRINITY_DN11051_c0_g1~~TRINITY_DN11051_c0_g1_i1.p1  ORF type:complete len:110 (-),score=16.83 TRINITY_DN11051_c0_g1_i1:79-387(-)
MASTLRTVAVRSARPAFQMIKRNASGHGDAAELQKQIEMWKKLSVVGFVATTGLLAFNFIGAHHHENATIYPYMNLRYKKFPWGDGDTPLFTWNKDAHGEHH